MTQGKTGVTWGKPGSRVATVVTTRPTQGQGWAGLEATGLDLLANAAKGNETPSSKVWLPGTCEDRVVGTPTHIFST